MENSLKQLLLIIPLLISGCASTSPPPIVKNNVFISQNVPRLTIQVSNELPFVSSEKKGDSAIDAYGSSATTAISTDRYLFWNALRAKGLRIIMEKFTGPTEHWSMMVPDYSAFPGIIVTGSIKLNGKLYSTGIFVKSETYGQSLIKSYGRVFGARDGIRFQIFYIEKINISLLTSKNLSSAERDYVEAVVEQFNSRADKSFEILPYTATTPSKISDTP